MGRKKGPKSQSEGQPSQPEREARPPPPRTQASVPTTPTQPQPAPPTRPTEPSTSGSYQPQRRNEPSRGQYRGRGRGQGQPREYREGFSSQGQRGDQGQSREYREGFSSRPTEPSTSESYQPQRRNEPSRGQYRGRGRGQGQPREYREGFSSQGERGDQGQSREYREGFSSQGQRGDQGQSGEYREGFSSQGQQRGRGRGEPYRGRGRGGPPRGGWRDRPQQSVGHQEGQQQSAYVVTPQPPVESVPLEHTTQETASLSLSTEKTIQPGTLGKAIRIEVNYVRLNLGSATVVYRYDVSIEPQKKPKRMLRAAMDLFRKAYYPDNYPSYDGQKLLYSAKKLPLRDDTASGSVNIEGDRGGQEFKITVKLTGTLDLSPLRNLLQKKNMFKEEVFQCVEIVFRQAYVNSFINVGRRFYTPTDSDLTCGAVMYLGGFQAAVQGSRLYMNVDVAHKAFTKTTPLLNLIVEMFSTRNRPLQLSELKKNLPVWQIEQLGDYLRGLKVDYQIPNLPGSKKQYRINELAFPANRENFQHEGRTMTVEQYFGEKCRYNLNYPTLPTLWVGSKDKRICIPMECCTLKEGQPLDSNKILGAQTAKMINYSATSTDERKRKIQNIMQKAGHNTNPYIQEFGFSMGTQFEQQNARVLDPPILQYNDGTVTPRKGTWWAKVFQNGARIEKWTILGYGIQQDRVGAKVQELARMIGDYGRKSGMCFAKPEEPFTYMRNDRRSLNAYLDKKKSYDLIIVVFMPNKDNYYTVKQEAEQRVGLLTQCIKSDTLYRLNETTVRNILLKINAKMNGTNHVLHKLGLITDEPCMIMGADVTHPGPQARTIPSVVAVTASEDLAATRYNISACIQPPKTEIILNLERITVEKLKRFKGGDPKRIYFFRDGVSDGEFDKVRTSEVAAIKRACQHCKVEPKLTFIVVQKRHHTRFFPADNNVAEGDKYRNVPVGTYVDTEIVDPTALNFYLLSHQSIKGVGRPTKYYVLYDENNLSSDVLIMAYYLCHVYTRCNRAVSYPAPTYFAHLAADRAKGYLYNKRVDLENLDQRLVKIDDAFADRNPMFFS